MSRTHHHQDSSLDLVSQRFIANPYPAYKRLLEHGILFAHGTWFVPRYSEACLLLRDQRLSKRLPSHLSHSPLAESMVFVDPPEHTRLRGVLQQSFSQSAIKALEGRMGTIADQLIEELKKNNHGDLHAGFASLFPIAVVADMLEVPTNEMPQLRRQVAAYNHATDESRWPRLAGIRKLRAINALQKSLRRFVELRRQHPRGGILTQLISAHDQGRINETELIDGCALLLIAGSDTTTNLLGTGLLTLLQHPAQMQMVQTNPGLIPAAIEEMLRYQSPVQRGSYRVTTSPIEIGSVTIPTGQTVTPLFGAANRDPREFTEPDRFNIQRKANRHIGFGGGIHACIGSFLARSEARVGFQKLLEAFPRLQLRSPHPESLRWRRNLTMRGLRALPVTW